MTVELDPKISAAEAAKSIGIKTSMLAKLRVTGEGPPFFKIGKHKVVYSPKDVKAWLESRRATKSSGGKGGRPPRHPPAASQYAGA